MPGAGPTRVDAFLAERVEVRDGRLDAVGLGWTRVAPERLPAVMELGLGCLFRLAGDVTELSVGVGVRLEGPGGDPIPLGPDVPRLEGRLEVESDGGTAPVERVVPLAIQIDEVALRQPGVHRFVIALDGVDAKLVAFEVVGSQCEGCHPHQWHSARACRVVNLPPGPRQPSLVQLAGFWTRPLPYLERLRARYGKRFTMRLPLTPPLVYITDPAEVKQAYTAPADVLHPGAGAKILEPVVGPRSVILLDEDAHMEQRKLMLPAFHGDRMERLTGLVAEVTEREVAGWQGEREVTLHPRLQALTLEIVLRAVFGLDPGPRLDAMRESVANLLSFGDNPLSLFGQPPDWLLPLAERLPMTAGFFRDQRRVDELLYAQIDERRRAGGDRDDILSVLLAASHTDGSPMTREEIRDELLTLLVAGHETTASALAWAFERLVAVPDVLDRLAAAVAGGDDAYVTATIQETLRSRPVLPNTAPRLVRKPIEVGGWHYEPGCALVANAYLMHHDPDIYPEPYTFRPERFLEKPPGTYSWIPFGGGRRRCLGASFALLEMKLVIRAILTRYTVSAVARGGERAVRRAITITPQRGSRVALGARTRDAPVPAAAVAA